MDVWGLHPNVLSVSREYSRLEEVAPDYKLRWGWARMVWHVITTTSTGFQSSWRKELSGKAHKCKTEAPVFDLDLLQTTCEGFNFYPKHFTSGEIEP